MTPTAARLQITGVEELGNKPNLGPASRQYFDEQHNKFEVDDFTCD